MLIDAISEEELNSTLSKRGRTVALKFAQLHDVRLGWLEQCAKDLMEGQSKIQKDGGIDKTLLKQWLNESADAWEWGKI